MSERSTEQAPAVVGVEREPGHRYWAFISYSHADERWASWLHRSIETYKVPKTVAGTSAPDGQPRPPRLFPLFRDREELSSAASLGERIEGALAASRNLIVICSPNAVRSRWVNEEIRAFKALGREGRVFCLIVDGEPNASDLPGSEQQECFPGAVRYTVGPGGLLTSERTEPLAADARADKDGKRNALLKLSAGLLDVGFDTLKRRDQERRTRQFAVAAAVLAVIVLLLLGLTVYAYWQKQAAEREARAARAALSGQVATHAQSALEGFPRRSLLLAVQALRITEDKHEPSVPAAKEALHRALAETGGLVFGADDSPVVAADLSPDGRWLVAAPERGAGARLWDLTAPAGGQRGRELAGAKDPVAISADSRWLATAGRAEDPVRLWDLTSADPSANPRVLSGGARPLRFSPNTRWLVTGGTDSSVRLWDLAAGPAPAPIVLPPHVANELGATISPDGRWLVTSSWHGAMLLPWMDAPRLYDLAAPRPETTGMELGGHTSSVTNAVFSVDSRWLATSSAESGTGRVFRSDTRVLLRDLTKPRAPAIELRGHDGPITAMAMSPDNRWLITGSADQTARVWSLTEAVIGATSVVLAGHDGPVIGVAVTPEGAEKFTAVTIAKGRRDGGRVDPPTVRAWRLLPDSKAPEATVMTHNGRPVTVSRFQTSGDGRRLLLASENTGFVIELQKKNPEPRPALLHAHEGNITTAVFTRDGRRVITGAQDGTARLWQLDPSPSASPAAIPAGPGKEVAASPDQRWLVTVGADVADGGSNRVAALWNLTTADVATRPALLSGHTGPIFAVAFSRDSRWLATASHDGTARLWDLRAGDPTAAPMVLRGHDGPVNAVAFTPDGHWLVTGSFDDTARLWDLTKANPAEASLVLRVDTAVFQLIVTRDSRWLIVTGARRASLWDLKAADPTRASTFLKDGHRRVLLAADDRWLVTHGSDEEQSLQERLGAARDSRTHHDLQQKLETINPVTAVIDLTATDPLSTRRVLDTAGEPVGASADGRWFVTQGRAGVPLLWALTSAGPAPAPVPLKQHPKPLAAIAFSPDGRWLVTGGYDETAQRWDLRAKDIAGSSRLLARFSFAADFVAISADNRRVLATGTKAAYLWEITADDAWPPPIALPAAIGVGGFSADGHWLITGRHDGGPRSVWALELDVLLPLACRTAGRNLTSTEWDHYFRGQPPRKTCPEYP